jgi:2-oxo-4-hydroxy-4-carboxy-5-ureidoimidazoline decarboxylase
MNSVLSRWNALDAESAAREVLPCCGSRAWAIALAANRPITDEPSLVEASSAIWLALTEDAWSEAFDCHPRIGQTHAPAHTTAESLRWSRQEQKASFSNDDDVRHSLADANRRYEQEFGRVFIVCASGKSASDILANLERRIQNDPETELREAAEQQRQITHLRLHRWLESK